MSCRRQYCPQCNQELIHRDNRKSHESSSAFGTIIHRTGPNELTFIDIDGCVSKIGYNALRIIEHKQRDSPIGERQRATLRLLDWIIRFAIKHAGLDERAGVFLIRGALQGIADGRREVDFAGPQTVYRVDSANKKAVKVLTAKTPKELWTWVNFDDPNWTPRHGLPRKEWRK
jgi:hypothetical protein